MQTQNRILQAVVVLMALMLITGIADAQKKKAKKTAPVTEQTQDTVNRAVIEEEPYKSEFVSVKVEPHPIQDIQSLVEYPEKAKRAGLEGKVIVSALIDTNGKVIKVEVDRSTNPIFEESARKAMMKARFTPALQNTKPVKLWYTLPIVFKLQNPDNITRDSIIHISIPESLERYNFVSVDVEPQPLQDIYNFVEYPEEAKKAGLEGRVVVYALIDTSGKVIQVEIDSSGYTILEESARKAMFNVQFTPAIKDDKAVEYWYMMPVLFKLYTIDK